MPACSADSAWCGISRSNLNSFHLETASRPSVSVVVDAINATRLTGEKAKGIGSKTIIDSLFLTGRESRDIWSVVAFDLYTVRTYRKC